jgi:hypothetical protein
LNHLLPQVQELQQRILDLEQKHPESTISSGECRPAHEQNSETMQKDPSSETLQMDHLNLSLPTNAPNEVTGGPWIIGNKRYPELKGRALRDVAVQVQLSQLSCSAPCSQGHAETQTEVARTNDRSSSPLPAPPPVRDDDVGKLVVCLNAQIAILPSASPGPNRHAHAFYMKSCLDMGSVQPLFRV